MLSGITGTATITVSAAAATRYTLTAPGATTAGTVVAFTVTALDQFNNTAAGYGGTVVFTSTDHGASTLLPSNSLLTSGVGIFSATLTTVGGQTLTATDKTTAGINGHSGTITIGAAATTHFSVGGPATATAGSRFAFPVTALDAFNNTAISYSGTVTFSTSDASASTHLPANSKLINGLGTFSATLATVGNQTITATDTVSASITGHSATITVTAATATHFTVTAPGSASIGAGFAFTVTALDSFNNTATSYVGTASFTTSDPAGGVKLPVPSTLTAGIGTFSATLQTPGNQTITATDSITTSITGASNTIVVGASQVTHFVISGAPSTAVAGVPFTFTVIAETQTNSTASNYSGTVTFSSSDAGGTVPVNSTLSNGTGTFSATLKTAGNQTLTATDKTTSSITGHSGAITVSAAAATHFTLVAPGSATAGSACAFTVTALDSFNNMATGYAGTVVFTSTDAGGTVPVNSTLSNGTGTFSATLKTAGNQTLTATDKTTSSITGHSGAITVQRGSCRTLYPRRSWERHCRQCLRVHGDGVGFV